MERLSFDELARLLAMASSRRMLGGALIAFLAGLLGVGFPDDTLAHNARKRCRKIKNKKKRVKCLKSAMRHKRKHQRKRRKNTTPQAECTSDTDCDQPAEACARAVCDSGKCEVRPQPPGHICRESQGICDKPECDGSRLDCPEDRFQDSNFVCRQANSECDAPETCSGLSVDCPTDHFKQNGVPCNGNGGVCCNGSCCQPPNICDDNRCCLPDGSSCGEPGDECCGVCSPENVCTASG